MHNMLQSRQTLRMGSHELVWRGQDHNNRRVGNGIYFVLLLTPTINRSHKVLVVP